MNLSSHHDKHIAVSDAWGVFMAIGDLAAIVVSFYLSIYVFNYFDAYHYNIQSLTYFSPFERPFLYILIGSVILFVFLSHGHYTQRIPWWSQIRLITISTFFAICFEGFASFTLEIKSNAAFISIGWLLFFLISISIRLVFFRIRKKSKLSNIPTVIIGDSSTISDILYAFDADPGIDYDIKKVFLRNGTVEKLDLSDLPPKYSQIDVEYDIDHYEDFIKAHPEKFYVLVLDTFRGNARDHIIDQMNQVGACYAIVPSTAKMGLYEMEPRYFFGFDVMLLFVKTHIAHPIARPMKRLLDIVGSLALIIGFLPMMILIALAFKLEGHEGSIFYGGERIGQKGRTFKCWKFRTMSPNSDHLLHDLLNRDAAARAHWEKYFKLKHDPRVKTFTAKLLRKASLDEIPQLFNVLCGDMSIVGPRPILPHEVDSYGDSINEYKKIRPGITGLWQVSGRNGVSFQRRVYWDSWYVRNWSLWGDSVIILKTIPAVLLRNDAH